MRRCHAPHRAVEALGAGFELTARVLEVPVLPELYEINDEDRQSFCVPAVATVFPLLIRIPSSDVPDLLVQVRRAPDLSGPQRAVKLLWPAAVAAICLAFSYGLVSKERSRHANSNQGRTELQSEIVASNIQFSQLARKREQLNYFQWIERQTWQPDWPQMLSNVTKSLPDSAKLQEFRVEANGYVQMEGTVIDESVVYEVVNTLRRLPWVTQVALKGTALESDTQSTRFSIRLATKQFETATTKGGGDE